MEFVQIIDNTYEFMHLELHYEYLLCAVCVCVVRDKCQVSLPV